MSHRKGNLRFSESERNMPKYDEPVSTAKKQKKDQKQKQCKQEKFHCKFLRETE